MLHIDTDTCCRVIDTAASQLTKTAITVTAIFIVALGYGSWYYLVGYSGATEYKFNTPLQIIGQCHQFSLYFVLVQWRPKEFLKVTNVDSL